LGLFGTADAMAEGKGGKILWIGPDTYLTREQHKIAQLVFRVRDETKAKGRTVKVLPA
jgi:hypothetical protein